MPKVVDVRDFMSFADDLGAVVNINTDEDYMDVTALGEMTKHMLAVRFFVVDVKTKGGNHFVIQAPTAEEAMARVVHQLLEIP